MRIIAGEAKGRAILAPKGAGTRPTSDRVRESLFNILGQFFDGERILDLFAGSGAMALEAISRGAGGAVLVESDREAASLCSRNAEALGFGGRVEVLRSGAAQALRLLEGRGERFDLIFLDPPYDPGPDEALHVIAAGHLLADGGRVVAEHGRRRAPDERYLDLIRTDLRYFGEPAVSIYERRSAESP